MTDWYWVVFNNMVLRSGYWIYIIIQFLIFSVLFFEMLISTIKQSVLCNYQSVQIYLVATVIQKWNKNEGFPSSHLHKKHIFHAINPACHSCAELKTDILNYSKRSYSKCLRMKPWLSIISHLLRGSQPFHSQSLIYMCVKQLIL